MFESLRHYLCQACNWSDSLFRVEMGIIWLMELIKDVSWKDIQLKNRHRQALLTSTSRESFVATKC